jgi:hypothetical protein
MGLRLFTAGCSSVSKGPKEEYYWKYWTLRIPETEPSVIHTVQCLSNLWNIPVFNTTGTENAGLDTLRTIDFDLRRRERDMVIHCRHISLQVTEINAQHKKGKRGMQRRDAATTHVHPYAEVQRNDSRQRDVICVQDESNASFFNSHPVTAT